MMSNNNENNQPKPSAALLATEKYLVYIVGEIQKLENGTRDDKSISFISQLEQALNSLWKQIMQFIENQLTINRNQSIKNSFINANIDWGVFPKITSKCSNSSNLTRSNITFTTNTKPNSGIPCRPPHV